MLLQNISFRSINFNVTILNQSVSHHIACASVCGVTIFGADGKRRRANEQRGAYDEWRTGGGDVEGAPSRFAPEPRLFAPEPRAQQVADNHAHILQQVDHLHTIHA